MTYDRKPCQDSGFLLWQISNIWQKKMNAIFTAHDITHVQYLLLATLAWMESKEMRITQKSLTEQARSHKMMTSKVIRALEREGYVERFNWSRDNRYRCIRLTDKGADKFYEVSQIFEKADQHFFGRYEMNRFSLNRIFTDMLEEERTSVA